MGHLLYLLGYIDRKLIHRYERDSKAIGKESFHFAWVLDSDAEERQRGVTIDVGCRNFSTASRDVVLLDAPGHKDFVPNMISGTAQADAAILVLAGSIGEFESGFLTPLSQTKEHSFLARSLGITQLIVAINKLDTVQWSQERYEEIKAQIHPFLLQIGFKQDKIIYLPLSGLSGENLTTKSSSPNLSWFKGPCLIDIIDTLEPSFRDIQKPLRLCIMDSYRLQHGSIQGNCVSGKLEGGVIKNHDRVVLLPTHIKATVKQIEKNGQHVSRAVAGDNVDISLKDVSGDFTLVMPGHVLCCEQFPVPVCTRFHVKVMVYDIIYPITKGLRLILHVGSLRSSVVIRSIVHQIDIHTGDILKTRPRLLTRFQSAVLDLQASDKLCLERFASYKSLGRVTLRERGMTVMAGMITEIIE